MMYVAVCVKYLYVICVLYAVYMYGSYSQDNIAESHCEQMQSHLPKVQTLNTVFEGRGTYYISVIL